MAPTRRNKQNNSSVTEDHVDPVPQTILSSSDDAAALEAGLTDAVEKIVPKGLGDFPERKSSEVSSPTTPTQVTAPTALSLTMTHEDELEMMVAARKMLAGHGVDEVQKQLKASIAKTKKYESDVTAMKKKAEKNNRAIDEKRHEMKKFEKEKDAYKNVANTLLSSKASLAESQSKIEEEDEMKREDIKKKYLADVEEVAEKLDAQKVKQDEMEAENVELEKEFLELKANLDETLEGRLEAIRERENESKQLIAVLTSQLGQSEVNQRKVKAKETEMQLVFVDIRQAEAQIKAYAERQEEFDAALKQSEKVQNLATEQKDLTAARLKQFDDIRREDEKKFLVIAKEVADLRREITQIRQKLGKADKNKAAAEKKCRIVQEAQKKKAAAAAEK